MYTLEVAGKYVVYYLDKNNCWIVNNYKANIAPDGQRGYYVLRIGPGGTNRAYLHRLVYEQEVGPLGNDLIKHLCNNALCINPRHMAKKTYAENLTDGSVGRRKTCRNGHRISEPGDIKIVKRSGNRTVKECLACLQEREHVRRKFEKFERHFRKIELQWLERERKAEVERLREQY